MILWKNIIIIGSALSLVYWIVARTLRDPLERNWLKTLWICCLVMTVTILTWNPYLVTMAVLLGTILFALSKGIPLVPTIFVLTAVVPVMRYRISTPGAALLDTSTLTVAGFAIIVAIWAFPKSFQRNPMARATDIAVILYIVASSVLSTRGFSIFVTLKMLISQCLIFGTIYYAASRGRIKSVRFLFTSLVFVGGAISLTLIVESLRHWPMFFGAYQLKGLEALGSRTANLRYGLLRASGPFEDPIACSMFISIIILACWGHSKLTGWKPLIVALLLPVIAALWLTFSRTGMVGLAVGMLVFAMLRGKVKEIVAAATAGAVLGLLYFRISASGASATSDYRVELFTETMRVIRSSLLLGDNNAVRSGKLSEMIQGQGIVDMVNAYLGITVQGGLLLLAIFLSVPVSGFIRYWKAKISDIDGYDLSIKVVISQSFVYLVGLAFTSETDKNGYYVFLLSGLTMGLINNARIIGRKSQAIVASSGERSAGA